jgi:hypothetical protein
MVAWPQWAQRNHPPSAFAFISLKLLPSTQYGHRMASGILVGVNCRISHFDFCQITLFVHRFAVFIGTDIGLQRDRLVADRAIYFELLTAFHNVPFDITQTARM